jgi:hypothetical protein
MELTAVMTLTVPPVLGMARESPADDEPRLLPTLTGTPLLPDSANDTVATTPLATALEFIPQAMQV